MMKKFAAVLALALLLQGGAAQACSPTREALNRTLKEKVMQAEVAFIGKVEEAAQDHTVFRILAAGQNASAKGETMSFPHQMYGTCGGFPFAVGQVWLFAGDGPFSGTRLLTEADMDAAFDDVVARLTKEEDAQKAETPEPEPQPAPEAPKQE